MNLNGGPDSRVYPEGVITMMLTNMGDRFKRMITGDIWEVKEIVDRMVLLERKNGKCQVIPEMSSLKLFYKNEEKKDERQREFSRHESTRASVRSLSRE